MALMVFTCFAQDNQPVVRVENFKGNGVNNIIVEAVRNKVLTAIQGAGRVKVIDGKQGRGGDGVLNGTIDNIMV